MDYIVLRCCYCGTKFKKEKNDYNRVLRNGRDWFYCTNSCACSKRNDSPDNKKKSAEILRSYNDKVNNSRKLLHKQVMAREGWRYRKLKSYLSKRSIRYIFEYPLRGKNRIYLYDLALLDYGKLIEFDGPYHCGKQLHYDRMKNKVASKKGWEVIRVKTKRNVVLGSKNIIDLIPF